MQWITFVDSEGRVIDSEALRKRIFYGGLDHELRNEVCILHPSQLIGWVSWLWIEKWLSSDISFMEYININGRSGVCFWDTIRMTQHMLRENSWSR